MDDRKHITSREIERLIAATKGARHEARDRCLLLLMFRHGLRVSEALSLNLSQIDLEGRTLHVSRLKSGLSTNHPLRADECRAIRAWLTEREKMKPDTKALFVSVRGSAHSRARPLGLPSASMARRQSLRLPPIPTCYATLAALPLPTKARTRG